MSKLLRKLMAQELTKTLGKIDCFILFGCDRLNSEQVHQFRVKLRENKVSVKILKNKLANIAFEEKYKKSMKSMLKGTIGMVYGGDSPVELAKIMTEWCKKNKTTQIKGGFLSGQVLTIKDITELSKVPPREVLLGELAGAFVGSMQQVATIFSAAIQNVSNALGSLTEKMEKQEKVSS